MAKNSVRDFDATAANNTDIQSVNIAEGCAPSGINNAIRELMADMKDVSAGTIALESPSADSLTVTGEILVGADTGNAFNAHAKLRVQKADHAYLQIKSANDKQAGVLLGDTDDDFVGGILYDNSTNHLQFNSGDAERMRIDSSGNVGIGVTPVRQLHVNAGSENVYLHLTNAGTGTTTTDGLSILVKNSNQEANIIQREAAALTFSTSATERMRIDSSGNLLVGKTSSDFGVTAGFEFYAPADIQYVTSDDQVSLILNRLTSYGEILRFRKDGSTDGQINVISGDIAIGTGDTGFRFGSSAILPHNLTTNALRDNAIDIGSGSYRYDDIFATNGTIQTSDQNEKQQIASLTDAEITAAKAISKLFKTFKWNDSVEAKGDNARIHAGHIAQEVQSAMTDAGIDATKYAFFCSDTWWETQTDVPAVEAVEAQDAVYDDDDNLVSDAVEAVEAKDAFTRVDAYYTADEAPEGATQRTRLGIRYPQLLAFIGAATEQRLTSIEARLTALEG